MERLLIIDDEPGVARVIQKVAAGCGYAVTVTTEANAFMDELVAEDPAVILMDLSMPDADGVELLRYLATVKSKARILIISGFDARVIETSGRLGSAMGLRIVGTLNKPIRVAELRAALSALKQEDLL